MAKLRKRLHSYTPVWKGFIEAIAVNHVHKNMWRLEKAMEQEDAMQEARLVFLTVQEKYPSVDTPQHFNALFVAALNNHFNKLAIHANNFKHYRARNATTYEHVPFEEKLDVEYGMVDGGHDGMLAIMIEQAPSEIKSVLRLFLTAPVEVLEQLTHIMSGRKRPADFDDKHLCAILGIRKGTKIREKMFQYFQ